MTRAIILSTLFFISSLISSKALSTPQAADTLTWYGQEFFLKEESGENIYLLEPFFKKHPEKRPKAELISSGHGRGYLATFELGYSALYLKDIEKLSITNRQENSPLPVISRNSVLNDIFPQNRPIRVDWFSGILVLRNTPEESRAEYHLIEIVNGHITDIRFQLNHEQYQVLKDKQYSYFIQTAAFDEQKQKRFDLHKSINKLSSTVPAELVKIETAIRHEVFDLTKVLYDKQDFHQNFPESYIAKVHNEKKAKNELKLETFPSGDMFRMYQAGQFILVYKRTEQDKLYLKKNALDLLADPESQNFKASVESRLNNSSSLMFKELLTSFQPSIDKRPWRSLNTDYFVFSRRSPYSNCNIDIKRNDSNFELPVIFHDACTDTSFDAAGRVIKSKVKSLHPNPIEARYNLFIPPYKFIDQHTLSLDMPVIKNASESDKTPKPNYSSLTTNHKLILAASYDDREAVQAAIADGADINYYDENNTSALDAAIMGSSTSLVSLLIKEGAVPNWEAFDAASSLSRTDIQRLLLKSGLD